MPQLDFSTYPEQIFWFFISFGLLYFFVRYFFFPRMQKLLNLRESKINLLLHETQELTSKIQQVQKSYENELESMNIMLKKIEHDNQLFCTNYYDSQLLVLEQKLLQEKEKVFFEISQWENKIESNMPNITAKISQALLDNPHFIESAKDLQKSDETNFNKSYLKIQNDDK